MTNKYWVCSPFSFFIPQLKLWRSPCWWDVSVCDHLVQLATLWHGGMVLAEEGYGKEHRWMGQCGTKTTETKTNERQEKKKRKLDRKEESKTKLSKSLETHRVTRDPTRSWPLHRVVVFILSVFYPARPSDPSVGHRGREHTLAKLSVLRHFCPLADKPKLELSCFPENVLGLWGFNSTARGKHVSLGPSPNWASWSCKGLRGLSSSAFPFLEFTIWGEISAHVTVILIHP